MFDAYSDTAIVVPAYNEAASIGLLSRELRTRCARVIVVDDGSHDRTGDLAEAEGAIVVRHPTRRGKGASLRTGFECTRTLPIDWVAILDADLQHRVSDLDRVVQYAKQHPCDMVIGQRSFSSDMPLSRRVVNRFMSFVINQLSGAKISDTQCGLRVLSKNVIDRLDLRSSEYEIETEMVLKAARQRFRIGLVEIQTVYTPNGKSSIRPVADAVRWLRLICGGAG